MFACGMGELEVSRLARAGRLTYPRGIQGCAEELADADISAVDSCD